jgi:hypothetical protein
MIKDSIVEEVRIVRKEIENEHNNDWSLLGSYLMKEQKTHKTQIFKGHPKKMMRKKVA